MEENSGIYPYTAHVGLILLLLISPPSQSMLIPAGSSLTFVSAWNCLNTDFGFSNTLTPKIHEMTKSLAMISLRSF